MKNLILNKKALEFAKLLISDGTVDRSLDSWEIDEPGEAYEDQYIAAHGYEAYGNWFLAINPEEDFGTKAHFEFPIGNFQEIFRSGVIAAEKRASEFHHSEIAQAAKELLDLIDIK